MHRLVTALLVLVGLSCAPRQQQEQQSSQVTDKIEFTAGEFNELIKKASNLQLVDVRTPEEFRKGHIEHAANVNINGDQFKDQMRALDKSKPVYIYCLSGARSKVAAQYLRENGYQEVYEMPGGILEWRSAGLPEVVLEKRESGGMNLAEYEELLKTDKLALVDFYAAWCAPCKKMEPYLEKISEEMADKVTVIRIDADDNPDLCKELGVLALPVLKLYKNEDLVWEHSGYIEEEGVRSQLN
ncbi:MAG: redoxin domain-containing protein [Lunatimonas sp.]|uniref:thioredoxin domain-containing protein n=1 Tax=Lunatimonas sp. TaxID=2060141 RepID=UPI00263AE209|nr:thioredoxin domain-containing protein [Lunatimonas sp.]MCC5936695.1 redoxin domain-containing protein [Lunatimonas sp.]